MDTTGTDTTNNLEEVEVVTSSTNHNDHSIENETSNEEDLNTVDDNDVGILNNELNLLKTNPITDNNDAEIYWDTDEWKHKQKHIFILSSAGKPIYSRYGNEDDFVTLFSVMQAISSVVTDLNDEIRSIHTNDTHFTFLKKGNILLVSVTRGHSDVSVSVRQLKYTYDQIVSILTLSQLTKIFEQYNNFDLRRLLAGSERLINGYIDYTENEPGFFLDGYECLPLNTNVRDGITQAIVTSCQKIKNLIFAFLLTENHLITMVKMKKYDMVPADIHLLFNLISKSQSFKTGEGWSPICFPNFDASGYLQAYISYLSDDCQACLILLTVDRDLFPALSEAKKNIYEKLVKNDYHEAIRESLNNPRVSMTEFDVRKLRHFIYKNKATKQFIFPKYENPYLAIEKQKKLLNLYNLLYQHMNTEGRPLKVIFQQLKTETILGWDTKGFELYAIFEPFVNEPEAILAVSKLLNCLKKTGTNSFMNTIASF